MQRISITNPQNIIDGTAKKYYFKLRNTGGPKGDKGDKGDTGATGPQGPQGNAATVSVGSTTTLPVGYDATVTNSGSIYNAVLDFGIPQGPQGPQGAKGDKGDTGAKGDTGPRGPQGERGTNATVYIGTTTTTNPGTQARVYNSGTENNAVLNFGIPRGEKGETGATGATGATGPAGQDGQNFTPTIVDSLPTTGNQSKLYLTPKAHTTQTATGNPITATVAEQAGAIESFQLDGDTYQQTYTGKNLCPPADRFTYTPNGGATNIVASGNTVTFTSSASSNRSGVVIAKNVADNTNVCPELFTAGYIFSCTATATDPIELVVGSSGSYVSANIGTTPTRISAPLASANFIAYNHSNTVTTVTLTDFQVELGSTATDFEPYVGGQASPNPSYPQQIKTVTGLQTVSINGTDYPIDLGSIELCKLGDYQDYIYKSDDKWYLRKETGKYVYNNNLGENGIGSTYVAMLTPTLPTLPNMTFTDGLFWCNSYTPTMQNNTGLQGTNAAGRIRVNTSLDIADSYAAVRALADANNLTIYYPLATPTDTEITNEALVVQLEAIRTAALENGANTITNTATGSNLAGDMEIGYYGYNPRNRYDKWLWLDINNNYEQLGS